MTEPGRKHAAFAAQVRDALAHLYEPAYLQTHALARYVEEARDSRGGSRRAGEALRKQLIEAIELLRPAAHSGPAARTDRAERAYRLLRLRYVEAMEPDAVWRELGVAKSQYFRDQGQAVDAVALVLAERWRVMGVPSEEGRPPRSSGTAPPQEVRRSAGAPRALTSFIGREREMASLLELLSHDETGPGDGGSARKLLTLTGSPGTGKTRLALEVGARMREAPGDREVWFVDLSPVSDPATVLDTIAAALDVRAAPSESARSRHELLDERLRRGRSLLILDNFEQVVDAAPEVAGLTARVPDLRVLVTSREALRVAGEQELWVPPLATPTGNDAGGLSLETLGASEAVRLFVDRARAVRSDFGLTSENAPAVAEICRRLDGLPLAIELAASRIRILSPQDMLERLGQRLALLSHGARDLPVRQRTLRSAISWSYDLLVEDERRLLRMLGVFSGGALLSAVEAVAELPAVEAIDRLDSLVSKSIVRREEGEDEPRFRLLETVREFALEELERCGEGDEARRRHAAYFLDMPLRLRRGLTAAQYGALYDQLEREIDNLRAALQWSIAYGDAGRLLEVARQLTDLWWSRGHVAEGKRWLAAAVGAGPARDSQVRARALTALGAFARANGDLEEAVGALEEAARVAQAVGDLTECGAAKRWMAKALVELGDHERARTAIEEGLALTREGGDEREIARSLTDLAFFEMEAPGGESMEAIALFHESIALLTQARQGQSQHAGEVLVRMAQLMLGAGDVTQALGYLRESAPIYRGTRSRPGLARWLAVTAGVALTQGKLDWAAHLAGAVDALVRDGRAWLAPFDRSFFERTMTALEAELGGTELERARAVGRLADVETAIDYAMGVID